MSLSVPLSHPILIRRRSFPWRRKAHWRTCDATPRRLRRPPGQRPHIRITEEECERIGGHCFERTGLTLTSNPPQYPEVCKHCGKRRVAIPQASFRYRDE